MRKTPGPTRTLKIAAIAASIKEWGWTTPALRRRRDDIDVADRGRARSRVRDPQNPSVWRCVGANLRLCAGGRLPRLCLRCGPDGAQSRAGARSARTCPGAFGLGRHRDPQADRISDPRKAEAGARSGGLVAGAADPQLSRCWLAQVSRLKVPSR